ncbi:lytic transglycosylase domain-containing protein [Candidatus Trichorickettsia mobilis]
MIMRFKLGLSIILIILQLSRTQALAGDDIAMIFTYLNDGKWLDAEKLAQQADDKALFKVILSQKFLDSKYKANNFEEVIKFIKQNPHWPQIEKLTEKAESYLSDDTDQKTIFDWFLHNKPKTGNGYKFYAKASVKLLNDQAKLLPILRDGWVYGDFTRNEEIEYLTNFGKLLREEDHVRRIDEQLWRSDVTEAKRIMSMVNEGYRHSFAAQIALINNSHSAEQLFKKIPAKYYTSGLLYRYLESKKKQPADSYIISLFKHIPKDFHHSVQWSKLQRYYAREFLEQKDFANAYKIVKQHFAIVDEDIRETEWLAGWIALRFIHKPELALIHFNKFNKVAKTPISRSRGAYWLARTHETNGDQEKATQFYRNSAKYPYTFYGQLATIELKEHRIVLPSAPKIESHHQRSIENNDVIRAARLLVKYGKPELAHIYVKAAVSQVSHPAEALLLANIIKVDSNPYYMVQFAKTAVHNHIFIKNYAFPTPYKLNNTPIEAALSYAIIRQESVFDQYAVSTAKAMGLMQLVKATACQTAKSIGVQCNVAKLTQDPNYNIKLGTNYLNDLLVQHKGSYILAIASYNAGSHRTKRWIDLFGDPRAMKNVKQIVDWLELIPYNETRNYVQRVLENVQVYRTILNKNNKLHLKRDLVLLAK